jgi:uncharacterized protein (TIGR02265 family)
MVPEEQAVVFDGTFDGLGRAFRSRLSPTLLAELRATGLDFDRLQPAYPLEVWEKVARQVAAAIFPGVPETEAWRLLGQGFVEGYRQTLLGASVMAMAKVLGVRRFVARMGRNFRTGSNFAQMTVTLLGDTEAVIESRVDPLFLAQWTGKSLLMPHYRLGVLEGALKAYGADATVELVASDAVAQVATYRVRWR